MRRPWSRPPGPVVGLPGRNGEDVVAAVVLDQEPDLDVVREPTRRLPVGDEVLRRVVAVDGLPRSQIGEVLRREVGDRPLADQPGSPEGAP